LFAAKAQHRPAPGGAEAQHTRADGEFGKSEEGMTQAQLEEDGVPLLRRQVREGRVLVEEQAQAQVPPLNVGLAELRSIRG
jgi:hypothetical protein